MTAAKRWRCGEMRTQLVLKRRHLPADMLTSPAEVAGFIIQVAKPGELPDESIGMVLFDSRMQVIGWSWLAQGNINRVALSPATCFKTALVHNATSICLFHNHPSGDPQPSEEDMRFTRRFEKAGEVLDIDVVDHLVFGGAQYRSMREEGMMGR